MNSIISASEITVTPICAALCALLVSNRMCCGTCLEGIWGNVTTDGDPARVCERLEIGCPAETRTGSGGADAAERRVGRVVHGLVVDVPDPGEAGAAGSR